MDKELIEIGNSMAMEVHTPDPYDFYIMYRYLTSKGLKIWNAEELALARAKADPEHSVNAKGTWVAENINYYPNGDTIISLRDYSPILKNPNAATRCHKNKQEYCPPNKIMNELRERAERNPEEARKSGALLLENLKTRISTEAFGEEQLTRFIGWTAAYGRLLDRRGFKDVEVYFDKKREKPFIRPFSRAIYISRQHYGWSGSVINDFHGLAGLFIPKYISNYSQRPSCHLSTSGIQIVPINPESKAN